MSKKKDTIPILTYDDTESFFRYGKLSSSLFAKIQHVIQSEITNQDLVEFMKQQKIPPVKKSKTGELEVNLEVRRCKRYTFDHKIIQQFSQIIEPYFQHYFKNNNGIIDIRMDPTHGDILYYEKGDFFGKHRDTIPETCHFCPFNDECQMDYEWKMYTLIICLDTSQSMNDGNTILWSIDTEFNNLHLVPWVGPHYGIQAMPHSFKLKSHEWILIPSESVHEVTPILKNEMTLKLKLDIWICKKIYSSADLSIKKYLCKCVHCKPNNLSNYQLSVLKSICSLGIDLRKQIIDFLNFYKPMDRCILDPNLSNEEKLDDNLQSKKCCCRDCIRRLDNCCEDDEALREEEEDDSYGYCNDY